MSNYFSKDFLKILRNEIPIAFIIMKILNIPRKYSEGHIRFLCPLCNEFSTAINFKSNLGRCFGCSKNFNTIDIVMADKKMNFKEAVLYLRFLFVQDDIEKAKNDYSSQDGIKKMWE